MISAISLGDLKNFGAEIQAEAKKYELTDEFRGKVNEFFYIVMDIICEEQGVDRAGLYKLRSDTELGERSSEAFLDLKIWVHLALDQQRLKQSPVG